MSSREHGVENSGDFNPRPLKVDSFGHKRNKSGDFNRDTKEAENLLKQEMNEEGGKTFEGKKKLSVTRNVNLPLPSYEEKKSAYSRRTFASNSGSPLGTTFVDNDYSADSTKVRNAQKEVITLKIFTSRLVDDDELENNDNVSGVQFQIEGGRFATVEMLLELMANELNIPDETAKEAFAIWMVSPLLEVQLKPYHCPVEVCRGWQKLLSRFVSANAGDIANDEPLLYFRRNVYLSVNREAEILSQHPQCSEFLVLDARVAMLEDRLPLLAEDAAEIAGLTFALDYGVYIERQHNIEFIRKNIGDHLPDRLCDDVRGSLVFGRALSGVTANEQRLIESWRSVGHLVETRHVLEAKLLREIALSSLCYGAAFFYGTIERPSISPLKDLKRFFQNGNTDIEVRVGINEQWITVLDVDKHDILLAQKLNDCSWRKVDSGSENDATGQLLLHFPDIGATTINENSEQTFDKTNLLQIFGSQTPLMEALLSSLQQAKFDDEYLMHGTTSGTESDISPVTGSPPRFPSSSVSSASSHKSNVSRASSFSKCNKLCLAKFDKGRCVHAKGSLKKVFTPNTDSSEVVM